MKGNPLLLHLFYTLLLFLGASRSSAGNDSNDDTKPKKVYIVYMGAADSSNGSLRNDHAQLLNSVLRRKLIGARVYAQSFSSTKDGDDNTPRDSNGHGTHVALAVYKVCFGMFCDGSAILAAFDDAIADGVDVLSLSLGGLPETPAELINDTVAIGAFHAVERGIVVVCAAGNDGPSPYSVVNDAPWILTVAASTIDRDLQSDVVLGDNTIIKGRAINFSPLSNSPKYPIIYGESAKANSTNIADARQCHEDSLDGNKVKGKIVVCDGKDDGYVSNTYTKIDSVKALGGIGLVHISEEDGAVAFNYVDYPATVITFKDGARLLQYINSTNNPVATVLPTIIVPDYKPAPMVVRFSSRGPSSLSSNILKVRYNDRIIYISIYIYIYIYKRNDSLISRLNLAKFISFGNLCFILNFNNLIIELNSSFIYIRDDNLIHLSIIYPIHPQVNSSNLFITTKINNRLNLVHSFNFIDYFNMKVSIVNFKRLYKNVTTRKKRKIKYFKNPDIAAPGVNILAAWIGNSFEDVPKGRKPSPYRIISGTSMACAHVSGLVSRVKTHNPTWSASAIKSAIMTTAIQNDNLKAPTTTDSGFVATPYDYGAGEITTSAPLQPGLVYETDTMDYLNYLCYIGINTTTIKIISRTVPSNFNCPKDSSSNLVSNINYPSIAINFTSEGVVTVSRTVTNVGEEDETVYFSTVKAPNEVNVTLIPDKLQFTKSIKKLSYQVIFSSNLTSLEEHLFGSITWSNGNYIVRSPFVLTA
uniref:Subtilisin-like protease n=1 Tax=Cajanus cajan TaxID=3821 RepID=A0A151RUV7_CAJCA|nr:Subtilisin-like protease [Cajanus cajan]